MKTQSNFSISTSYSFFKTTILLVFGLLLCDSFTFGQPQTQFWNLPPNLVSFTSAVPSASLLNVNNDYTGLSVANASACSYDKNGNLLFFVVDDIIFDKNGFYIDFLTTGSNQPVLGSELCIVPKPGSCSEYYIIGSVGAPQAWIPFYAVIDMALPNLQTAGSFGQLQQFGNGSNMFDLSSISPFEAFDDPGLPNSERNRFGMAISPRRTATNDHFLFMKGFDSSFRMFRYIINATGIFFDSSASDGGTITYSPSGSDGNNRNYPEMELVDLGTGFYRLGWVSDFHKIFVAEVNYLDGTYVANSKRTAILPFVANFLDQIIGLEFSPNGNNLYYTYNKADASGTIVSHHIGHIDLVPTVLNPVDLPNTYTGANNLGFSFIEMGFDGKLHYSDGNQMYALANPDLGPILGNWSNSLTFITPAYGNLPDQMDGEILKFCTLCACSDGAKMFNNLATNGDFSAGYSGFSTSQSGPSNCGTGNFNVTSNFNVFCTNWQNLPAHSAPNFLCIDGNGDENNPAVLWQTPIFLTSGSEYCFSFWWALGFPHPSQNFPISIDIVDANGMVVSSTYSHIGDETIVTQLNWTNTSFNWLSGTLSGAHFVAIRQLTGGLYRDFGIDDICFSLTSSPCEGDITYGQTGFFPFNGLSNTPNQSTIDLSTTSYDGYAFDVAPTTSHNGFNSAALFNGNSSWIDCNINNRGVVDKVSVCAWVKTSEQNLGQFVAGQYDGLLGAADHGYLLAIGNSVNGNIGQASFSGRDGTSVYHSSGFSSSNNLINDGNWHCLVGTAGNDQWAIYLDGSDLVDGSISTGTTIDLRTSIDPFTIGRHSDATLPPLWMNGSIDDVRVYNRVLNDCEIDSICNLNMVSSTLQISNKTEIRVVPNPNNGSFSIELPFVYPAQSLLRIIDLRGRLILEKEVINGSKQENIEAVSLPKGLYFIQIIAQSKNIAVEKFVVE
jgi:hypothetical protein